MEQQQRQLQKPKVRRSRAEWIVSWIVCLWGVSVFLGVAAGPLTNGVALGLRLPLLLHGLFCLAGSLLSLARLRRWARFLLSLAGCMLCVLSGVIAWLWVIEGENRTLVPLVLGLVGGLTIFALGFALLGRWLGMQEDSE